MRWRASELGNSPLPDIWVDSFYSVAEYKYLHTLNSWLTAKYSLASAKGDLS